MIQVRYVLLEKEEETFCLVFFFLGNKAREASTGCQSKGGTNHRHTAPRVEQMAKITDDLPSSSTLPTSTSTVDYPTTKQLPINEPYRIRHNTITWHQKSYH